MSPSLSVMVVSRSNAASVGVLVVVSSMLCIISPFSPVNVPHGITFTDVKTFSCADRDQGHPYLSFPIPALKDLRFLHLPHIAAIDPE